MDEKSYIPSANIINGLSEEDFIPAFRGVLKGGDIYDAEKVYINAANMYRVDKTFAPTVSDLVGGTFTVTNFLITDIGGVVEFSFFGRFDLAPATTSGNCKIDLPPAFQPTANWASQTDVNVVLHRTNGLLTGEYTIQADSGTKLLVVNINDATAEISIRFSAIGRYKIA